MKKRTKEKEDIKMRRQYLQALIDQYLNDKIDDTDILKYVSNELSDLEEDKKEGFEKKILKLLNIDSYKIKKGKE